MIVTDPRPVQPAKLCIHGLQTAELFVVLMLRLWAQPKDERDGAPEWRDGFLAAGIAEAEMHAFDSLLRIQASVGARRLDVCGRICPRLSVDEARFLSLVGLTQRDCLADAETVLGAWLPPAGIRMALPHAITLATGLTRRNMIVPLRCVLTETGAAPRLPSYPDPGLWLTH
jgi:hypothetical protein